MHFLITGGAGFLGSHLTDECLQHGRVTVLDNLSTGNKSNLAKAIQNPAFTLVECDIRDEHTVEREVQKADLVCHLAASVGVRHVLDHPINALTTNAEGTRKMFSACARHGKTVIFSSTSEVYGKALKQPLKETDDLILGPTQIGRWGYACSKAIDEFLAHAFARELGLKFIILRYFNVVGPRQSPDYGMVIPRFVHQTLKNEPITLFGDGSQSRCFIHVIDAIKATMQLASCPQAVNQVVNIGNPQPITILELAKRIILLTESKSKIQSLDPQSIYGNDFADMQTRIPDVSKLKTLTGFVPTRPIEEALRDVMNYMKDLPRVS